VTRAAKETHLADAVAELERREHPPDQRVHRQRQDQVEEQRAGNAVQDKACRGGLAEHELQDELTDEVERRDHRDRHVGRVEAIAGSRLAVPSDPEPADRQQEGGDAERSERCGVEQQAGQEAGDGPEDRASQERDGQQRHEDDAGGAEQPVFGEHRDLQKGGDEQDERGLHAVHQLWPFQ
jgi:hypothetical protein